MRRVIVFSALIAGIFCGCTSQKESGGGRFANALQHGKWKGSIASDEREIPFLFEVVSVEDRLNVILINGKEKLPLNDVSVTQDSVHISIPLFDTDIHARIKGDTLEGIYVKNYLEDYRLHFIAVYGDSLRFGNVEESGSLDFQGKWEVDFIESDGIDKAIGLFEQAGNYVTGTFATPSGDYRFLEGVVSGNVMKLSTFDGTHLYLFEAVLDENGIIDGSFWSGKSYFQKWTARRNDAFELPDPASITFLNPGYDEFDITFPDSDGKMVSISDERYHNKPVVVQLMGSWCPNCMDESKFLAAWYDQNRQRGVEILGLAFERKPEPEYANLRVKTMKEKLGIGYEVLIAGTTAPESRAAALPMLNKVTSFPTTIFLDRKHQVRKIHTGFSGPGTGDLYDQFIEEYNSFMDKLIEEPI